MSNSSLDLARSYSSFSGVDIRVVIAGKMIGEMQAISYAVQREKAPIYVMGKVDPISFSRGKRGIAGTMISLLLDEHLLAKHGQSNGLGRKFVADKDEIYPSDISLNDASAPNGANLGERGDAPVDQSNLTNNWQAATPHYVDQVLPFDVTIMAVSELGNASAMRIYGCEILNEGSGFSIDDIVIESQMTYVCRTILPWKKLASWAMGNDGAGAVTAIAP